MGHSPSDANRSDSWTAYMARGGPRGFRLAFVYFVWSRIGSISNSRAEVWWSVTLASCQGRCDMVETSSTRARCG
jgi:hypothetical protein